MLEKGWVVIPCYNEEGNVLRLVLSLEEEFRRRSWEWQILCVNDGSTDGTPQEIEGAMRNFPNVHRLDHEKNQGYAQAVKTAVRFLLRERADFFVLMDADLTHDPSYLSLFHRAFEEGADVVIGSRYVAEGKMEGVPFWRQLLSWAGNLIGRLMGIPVRDATSGFRGFSKQSLSLILDCREDDFSIQLEEVLLGKKRKLHIQEVPITLRMREVGESKFHYSFKLFWRYARLLIRDLFL